jgi:hypothetical protein
MPGRKGPADDTSVPVDFLRMLLHPLEEKLPRALELRERLHMIPEPRGARYLLSRRGSPRDEERGVSRPYGPPGARRTSGPRSSPSLPRLPSSSYHLDPTAGK